MEEPLNERARFLHVSPEAGRAQSALDDYIQKSGLEPLLLELVKMRASIINGCAYCLQLHSSRAVKAGERPERLFQLNAWHESPVYTPRERAALAWTDAVTMVDRSRVSDEVYAQARAQFSEKELVDLTWAVVSINSWNRLSVSFRAPPRIDLTALAAGPSEATPHP